MLRPLQFVGKYWLAPEAHFSEIRDRSERWLSQLRLGTLVLFIGIAIADLILRPSAIQEVSVVVALFGLVAAGLFHLALLRRWSTGHLPFAAILLEIGLVGFVMAGQMAADSGYAGTNDRVLFPLLLVIIGGTTLRFDPRTSLFAGALALMMYGIVATSGGLMISVDTQLGSPVYGIFDWTTQWVRCILIVLATLAATMACHWVQQMVSASSRDDLTGLLNRRVLNESLHKCVEAGRSFALVMADVDHFKKLNDSEGHAAGDAALRHLASLLQRSFRTVDVVTRYGGEEFAILMIDAAPEGSVLRLDQVRELVATSPIRVGTPGQPTRTLPPITVSIGVAVWPEDGPDVERLLETADQRLYEAKRAGRNRLVGPNLGISPELSNDATEFA